MPWRYPVGWFAGLLFVVGLNNLRPEEYAAFRDPAYALGFLAAIGLGAYAIAIIHWRFKR